MNIKNISVKDIQSVIGMITDEFPYKGMSAEEMEKRIKGGKVFVFKTISGKKMTGFVDVEITQNGKAIINGISVLPEYRRKAIGEKLMNHAIGFARKKGAKDVRLLVKVGNFPAKRLYKKVGFSFNRYFDRKIDNSIVEEMQILLNGNSDNQ